MTTSRRVGISVLEAGWLLGKTEAQVRYLLKAGVLTYSVAPRWVDATSVRALLADDDELALEALGALLGARLVAPRPPRRYAAPPPIFPFLLSCLLADAVLVGHSCAGRHGI